MNFLSQYSMQIINKTKDLLLDNLSKYKYVKDNYYSSSYQLFIIAAV